MIPLPTLRQLQFFSALVQRKSFSKAAEDCHVSQSTLSSAIKELEALLDAQLVDRSTRSFSLTPAGDDVARRASAILAMAEDLAKAAANRRPLEGPFHLGVIPTIAPFVLPKCAPALRAAYPRLELYLREDLTATLADRLASGQLDAAILAFPYDLPGMEKVEIGDDPFYFAASPGHPLLKGGEAPMEEMRRADLLLLEDGHCLREHAMEACKLRDPGRSAYGATSLFTLTQMVQAGLGATLLPKIAVDAGLADAAGLGVAPVARPAPARRIGVAWRTGSGRQDEATRIAALLAELFQDTLTNVDQALIAQATAYRSAG
ncbi:MAG: hydrogen peroxide-inducible genes activator [Parvularculaceae bacterium]